MNIDKFIAETVATSNLHRCFYHFTDQRNLPMIKQHGLLSVSELRAGKIKPAAMGGNDWSQDADTMFGMDRYVHLCFTKNHPMAYLARQDGRIENCVYLKIDPTVLHRPGVLISAEVSNKSGAARKSPPEMLPELDLEVLYRRTDWRDPAILERLKNAEKYEILVPNNIPVTMIWSGL